MPTGTVTFVDAGGVLATVPLNAAGTATMATTFTSQLGDQSVHATYAGDANHAPAASAVPAAVVVAAPPATGILLTADLLPAHLPPTFVAGVARPFTLPVVVDNHTDYAFRGVITVNVYASADGQLDGADTVLATSARRSALFLGNAHARQTEVVPGLPASLAAGAYHLLVQSIDPYGYGSVEDAGVLLSVVAGVATPALTFAHALATLGGRPQAVLLRVADVGNLTLAGTVAVTLSVPVDGVDTAVAALTRRVSVGPGGRTTIVVRVPATTAVPAGTYRLTARLQSPLGVSAVAADPATITVAG